MRCLGRYRGIVLAFEFFMQRSAVLFLVAGCVVAAVVVMLAFSSGDQPVAPPGGRTVDGMGSDGGNSVGTGPSGNEPSRPQGTVALTVPPNAPQVRITVTAREQFVAPPDGRELAVSVDGTPLDTEIVAGVGAGFDAVAAQRGIALVAVSIASGQLLRHIAIDPVSQTAARIGPSAGRNRSALKRSISQGEKPRFLTFSSPSRGVTKTA